MNKSSSNKDTGTKVLAKEENFRWDLHPCDLLCNYWETGAEDRREEHDDWQMLEDRLPNLWVYSQTAATCSGKS